MWLVGNALELVRKQRPNALADWAKQYGPVYKFFQGGTVVIVIADAAAARTVNMRNHSRAPLLTVFSGKEAEHDKVGLLIADSGPYWQSLRQAWQAMFHPDSLKGYVGFINTSADHLVDALAPSAKSGQPIEIWRLMGRLTLDVVGSAAFGMDLNCFDKTVKPINAVAKKLEFDENDEISVVIQKVAAIIFGFEGIKDSVYPALRALFPEARQLWGQIVVWLPDRVFKRLLKGRRLMRVICKQLIDEARARSTSGQDSSPPVSSTVKGASAGRPSRGLPPGGFVQHMLKFDNKLLGRPFTDLEIASQINTFLLAGYETTASALTFTCFHLAQHPEIERKLLEEIDAFGRSKDPSYDDLSQLPYLTACLNESLRLTPPVGFGTLRINREETELCGFRIPKGAFLNTAMHAIQHSERYWKDPMEFRPERMLDPLGISTPAFAPFGEGGRSCVGLRLAYLEAKIALLKVYQHYTLRLTPGQVPLQIISTLSDHPANGTYVTVHPRA